MLPAPRPVPLERLHVALGDPTRTSTFPQTVENSGDERVDEQWTGVDDTPSAVDERWTPGPQALRRSRGRTVDADYRGPHASRNYNDVMGTTVDDGPMAPHRLHTTKPPLTCDDAVSSTVSTPPMTTMNLNTSSRFFTGPVGKSRAGATP